MKIQLVPAILLCVVIALQIAALKLVPEQTTLVAILGATLTSLSTALFQKKPEPEQLEKTSGQDTPGGS